MLHKFHPRTLSMCLNLNVVFFTGMTIDEKFRYGMVALGGASLILTAMGLHISPLQYISGAGDM